MHFVALLIPADARPYSFVPKSDGFGPERVVRGNGELSPFPAPAPFHNSQCQLSISSNGGAGGVLNARAQDLLEHYYLLKRTFKDEKFRGDVRVCVMIEGGEEDAPAYYTGQDATCCIGRHMGNFVSNS